MRKLRSERMTDLAGFWPDSWARSLFLDVRTSYQLPLLWTLSLPGRFVHLKALQWGPCCSFTTKQELTRFAPPVLENTWWIKIMDLGIQIFSQILSLNEWKEQKAEANGLIFWSHNSFGWETGDSPPLFECIVSLGRRPLLSHLSRHTQNTTSLLSVSLNTTSFLLTHLVETVEWINRQAHWKVGGMEFRIRFPKETTSWEGLGFLSLPTKPN